MFRLTEYASSSFLLRRCRLHQDKNSLPLESIRVLVPQPSANQVLIHVYSSSLNPLEYKLALLNFFWPLAPWKPALSSVAAANLTPLP
jgi:NADPH:quinone reductase-like Zn-dependent oxidoreductase